MNDYYTLIKNKLIDNQIYERVKDYSKERNRVVTYYEIGRLLSEAGSRYGEDVIGEYSKKLIVDVGKKYNKRILFRMRQFYSAFCDFENMSAMPTQLNWSHIQELLPIKNKLERAYYINLVITLNLTHRGLRERIKSREYYRLPESTRNKFILNKEVKLKDTIKNPIIFYSDSNDIKEHALQMLILENIPYFLDELGESFTFIRNEYRIKLFNTYNYIDLLLYNIKYKCYVVVELKVTELKKEHIGQIQTYMNYCDKNLKTIDENPTLGIIICKKSNNELVVDYSSNENIIAREYVLRVKERDT
jgi:predicted nuclease of restriction endonuclease-like (RecB) superfamily